MDGGTAERPWLAPSEDPDLAGVLAGCLAALDQLPSRLVEPGRRLLARLSTVNWLLEWNLPRWLGQAWGLKPGDIEALGRGNAFGLATIRLQDDLADGEGDGEIHLLAILAAALYELCLLQYVPLFDGASPVWGWLQACLDEWRWAVLEGGGPSGAELRADGAALLRLARRGAPLKVCAAASCLLAAREADLPALAAGIDRLLAGAVLVDHAQDWASDLGAGRYNAFVAWASARPQEPGELEANRRAVLEELWLGQAGRAYFERAQEQFRAALERVRPLGCPELERYLVWAEVETARLAARMAVEARSRLQAATERLFGAGPAADGVPLP